jgi:hypothetical protein
MNKTLHPGGAMGAGREKKKIIHLKKSVVAVKSVLYPNGKYNVKSGLTR